MEVADCWVQSLRQSWVLARNMCDFAHGAQHWVCPSGGSSVIRHDSKGGSRALVLLFSLLFRADTDALLVV